MGIEEQTNRLAHELKAIRCQMFNNTNCIKEIIGVLNMAVDALNRLIAYQK